MTRDVLPFLSPSTLEGARCFMLLPDGRGFLYRGGPDGYWTLIGALPPETLAAIEKELGPFERLVYPGPIANPPDR